MIFFYLLITVMPLARHPLWARFMGDLTMIKYLGLVCLFYTLPYMIKRGSLPHFFQTWQARCFVFLALLAITSYLTMGSPTWQTWKFSQALSYVSFLLLFYMTLVLVDSVRRMRWVLLVAIGSVAFASLYILREWQREHALYAGGYRPGWIAGDPNYFVASALICLPLAFYLMLERRPRYERLFCLGCLLVTLVAVTLAASRGGTLGLLAAFLFVLGRTHRRMRNLVVAIVLLLPLSLALPSSPIKRFQNTGRGDEASTETRLILWKAGLLMIRMNPMLGVGLGNFRRVSETYAILAGETWDEKELSMRRVAHNSYIEMAAELGLPGLLAFLGILFFTYQSLERVRRRTLRSGPSLLCQAALGVQAGLVGYAVAAFFISGQYLKLFWLMVFLSMCLDSLASAATTEPKGVSVARAQASYRQMSSAGVWARP